MGLEQYILCNSEYQLWVILGQYTKIPRRPLRVV